MVWDEKTILFIVFMMLISVFTVLNLSVSAAPPPCSDEQLLEKSDWVVEGRVINISCGEPYRSWKCYNESDNSSEGFTPELIRICTVTIEVTKVVKGNIQIGDNVTYKFSERFQEFESTGNGEGIICANIEYPYKGNYRVELNSLIRYYNTSLCTSSNKIQFVDDGNKDNDEDSKGIPGSEMIVLISALALLVFWKKRKY